MLRPSSDSFLSPSEYSEHCFNSAAAFTAGVLDGSIPAGKLQRLAVQRHEQDLVSLGSQGFVFSKDSADRIFKFFSFLRHSIGRWANQQFLLSGWQAWMLMVLFGWLREDGTRRFRTAYCQVARKNGKTTLAAGIGLYLFSADSEQGAEVYTAATKRDQARIAHQEAIRMRSLSKELSQRIAVMKDNLHIVDNFSKFEPLGSDSDTLDGLNVHGAIVDELHAHKNRGVWDKLVTATGSRSQPMVFSITTAGNDKTSICWEQRSYAEKLLERSMENNSFFAFICEPDQEDEWTDKTVWKKANPNLGESLFLEGLEDDFRRAKDNPAFQNSFRQLRLDQWTEQAERFIDMQKWDACPVKAVPSVESSTEEKFCYAGLDLSSTQDLSAFVLCFPGGNTGTWHLIPRFYLPSDDIKTKEERHRVPYTQWAREGFITLTPGNVIDYAYIEEDVYRLAEKYLIHQIGYDPFRATEIVQRLQDSGLEMVEVRQGALSLDAPLNRLNDLVVSGRLNHMGNPIMRWMAGSLAVKADANDNLRPLKADGKDRYKIDGIVASLIAINRAIAGEENPPSVYETQGIEYV